MFCDCLTGDMVELPDFCRWHLIRTCPLLSRCLRSVDGSGSQGEQPCFSSCMQQQVCRPLLPGSTPMTPGHQTKHPGHSPSLATGTESQCDFCFLLFLFPFFKAESCHVQLACSVLSLPSDVGSYHPDTNRTSDVLRVNIKAVSTLA